LGRGVRGCGGGGRFSFKGPGRGGLGGGGELLHWGPWKKC